MNHTPGPWSPSMHRCDDGTYVPVVQAATVAAQAGAVAWPVGVTDEQMHANARLIAAAPDLLAALSEIDFMARAAERNDWQSFVAISTKARAAIAKATA